MNVQPGWPAKAALGIFYVDNRGILMDIRLVILTVYAMANRDAALRYLFRFLERHGCEAALCKLVLRRRSLEEEPFLNLTRGKTDLQQ